MSKLARPYLLRFRSFSVLTWPSVWLLLHQAGKERSAVVFCCNVQPLLNVP